VPKIPGSADSRSTVVPVALKKVPVRVFVLNSIRSAEIRFFPDT
jgi:hypothetical protein